MNGFSKITSVEGVEHTLYFGMQAVEEFAMRTERYLSGNSFKIAVDMIFAGIANQMTKLDMAPLPYGEVYSMIEALVDADKEAYNKQYEAIENAFWESKHGKDYADRLKEIKKKVDQEIELMMRPPENTGTD